MKFSTSWVKSSVTVLLLALSGCGGNGPYSVNMMPSPEVYSTGVVNPFSDDNPVVSAPWNGLLYVTNRLPSGEGDKNQFYSEIPSSLLRLGISHIKISGKKDIRWEELRQISILKNRKEEYPLVVDSIEEFGILDRSYYRFMDPATVAAEPEKVGRKFAGNINDKLAISKQKDIYIYVHGYNTNFEDPILVSAELWHYLNYDGVFIAYSWPATNKGTAYFGDTEKANWSGRHLRMLLQYLSDTTDAENIHIIGYSMGTRVTTQALHDLSMMYFGQSNDVVRQSLRLGNVILISGDLSTQLIGNYYLDGILDIVKSLSIYSSEKDSVLGASDWIFDHKRLGQMTIEFMKQSPVIGEALVNEDRLRLIDASRAVGVDAGKGHQYFRSSPWVSSDVLMTLMYDLPPGKRGLVRNDGPVWGFPEDYISRLQFSFQQVEQDITIETSQP
ncbi:MAG: alpha/beta hydrolase [Proteobacteria bacterium]|nr:alpha/beta hydrolase [Pseudomonadota bacterium]